MKFYPVEDTKYHGKQESAEINDSKVSKGKQLVEFPGGVKVHLRNEDVGNFFTLKDPKIKEKIEEAKIESTKYSSRPKAKQKSK